MKFPISFFLAFFSAKLAAQAGDITNQLSNAQETVKSWGTDATLVLVIATVGFAIVTRWYCPSWLERAKQHADQAIGGAVFVYLVFYFFGETIKESFVQHLNFWNWFGL